MKVYLNDGSCSKSNCLTLLFYFYREREKERKSECIIYTVVYQDEVESVGIIKCQFRFNKQSDEYDPEAITLKTRAPLCLVNE